MPTPNTYWFYNKGTTDAAKTAGSGADSNFDLITGGSSGHILFWTGASAKDGDPTSTRSTIKIPASGSKEIDKTFVDNGTTIEQVALAGTDQGQQSGGAKRYVFCVHIDGATTSQVFLEAWDSDAHTTTNKQVLGAGTPANSYIKGITTTYVGPVNADWVANNEHRSMAGSGTTNRLELSSAVLTVATNLYFNLAARVPATATPFGDQIIFSIRFTCV